MSGIMDLSFLTEEEQRKILDVLKRDERLKKEEDRRVRKLRQELQELRKKGAIKADTDNSGKKCARCRESLGWFINAGELCPKCQHKVCKKCQVLQTSGRRKWLCLVCNKQMEIKARTGEWFYEKIPQVNNAKLVGTDLVRASMRSGPPSRDSPMHRRYADAIRHSPKRSPYRHRRHHSGETVTDSVHSPHGSPRRYSNETSPRRLPRIEPRDSDSSSQHDTCGRFDGDSLDGEKRAYPPVPEADQFPVSQRPYEHYRVHELKRRSSSESESSSPQVSMRSSIRSSPPIYINDGMDTPTTTMSENLSEAEERLQEGYAHTDSQSEPGVESFLASDTHSMSSSLLNNNNTAREIGDGADSEKDKLSHSGHVASDLSDSEPEIVTEVLSGVAFQRMTVKAGKSQRSPGVVRRGLEVVEENDTHESSIKPIIGLEPSTDSGIESLSGAPPGGESIHRPPSPSSSLSCSASIITTATTDSNGSIAAASTASAFTANSNTQKHCYNECTIYDSQSSAPRASSSKNIFMSFDRSTEHYYPEPHSPEHKVIQDDGDTRPLTLLEIAQGKSRDDISKESNGSVPVIQVTATVHHEEDENIDKHFVKGHSSTGSPARISQLSANTLSCISIERLYCAPPSSFYGSVDSLTSFYSSAGERNFGKITVTGDIKFGLSYNYKTGVFEVKIVACRDLAPVDVKRNTSDPYAKTYLLPDKTKNGKRKTRIKKRTLNPAFDETLKYLISESELQTRTLWISIWHNDAFGHNDFLGEIQLPLDDINLEDFHPEWRPLCPRVLAAGMESTLSYKGDLTIAIKFIPADASNGSPSQEVQKGKSKKKAKNPPEPGKGAIHVHIKDARNLIAVRINGYSDPFAKCYLLPNKSKSGKRKTEVIKKNCNPHWDETFIYEGVNVEDLKERALEVTLWDRESMASNDFLGGLRLGVGNGKSYGKEVKWQDSRSAETALWQRMLDNQNQWVEANLMLRSHMNGKEAKEPEFI